MNRRSFFKVVTGFVVGIFAGSAKSEPQSLYKCDPNSANIDPNSEWAKQKPLYVLKSGPPGPTTLPIYDEMSASAPFVQHNGIWFFADQDIIKYCPKDKLHWDNWESRRILFPLERYDYFDFWLLEEGKLFWCGEHDSRFEIIEDYEGRICIKVIKV